METRSMSFHHEAAGHILVSPGEYSGSKRNKKSGNKETNKTTEEKIIELAQTYEQIFEEKFVKLVVYKAPLTMRPHVTKLNKTERGRSVNMVNPDSHVKITGPISSKNNVNSLIRSQSTFNQDFFEPNLQLQKSTPFIQSN